MLPHYSSIIPAFSASLLSIALNRALVITALDEKYPAYIINNVDGYGVAILYNNENDVCERFSSSKLYTDNIIINGKQDKYLILLCSNRKLRYEFAMVCTQFVDPGLNGSDRNILINNPLGWWKKWQELLGDIISKKEPYSLIAEMLALNTIHLLQLMNQY